MRRNQLFKRRGLILRCNGLRLGQPGSRAKDREKSLKIYKDVVNSLEVRVRVSGKVRTNTGFRASNVKPTTKTCGLKQLRLNTFPLKKLLAHQDISLNNLQRKISKAV